MQPMLGLLRHVWERYFGEPLREVEAKSIEYRLANGPRSDWQTPTILVTAAACLIIQQYTANPNSVAGPTKFVVSLFASQATAEHVEATLRKWHFDPLANRIWWAGIAVLTYAVIPMLMLKLVFRAKLTDYGLKIRGILKAWPLYVFFVCVMVPLVWFFSSTEHFQQIYPFLRVGTREEAHADLWKWELAYAAQFIALEFFFRGFIVHGTKHRFGVYAVFVSMVPYVQIHFLKPMPEACASIVAGVVLGYMSLVTRSVWLGAALHIGVAWGMDSACLYRRGLL
jgi:membrane protease YdiL (CAAX protease family)